ncbi:MAG: sugar phosphate nucleotidyltransferase [Candidatus Omnitrophota bacterium]|jgi:mannose-1-phosphate guanylyltransferase/mannose-6-phosphate isomerase
MQNKPIVLILCGGRSLRLWPLSEYKSKNFIDIFGFSPLEFTVKRFLKVTSQENIFLVANASEKAALTKLKLIKRENIFFEPESKNTSAAILFSLFCLRRRFASDKVLIISPVDHLIKEEKHFSNAINTAINVAKDGWIATLGIEPTHPTSNFGYIQAGEKVKENTFSIKRFVEKPTLLAAGELIRKGNAFYNSGMFIASFSTLDKEYKKYSTAYDVFANIFKKVSCYKDIRAAYKKIEDMPFDKAIMEKTKKARLVKAKFFWKDFGSWHAIYEVLPKDKNGNAVKGNVFAHNAGKNFLYLSDPKKKVLVMGLEDVFFIDTGKFTLLAHRNSLDNLKTAIKEFKSKK